MRKKRFQGARYHGCLATVALVLLTGTLQAAPWWSADAGDTPAATPPAAPDWLMPPGVAATISATERTININYAHQLTGDIEVEALVRLDPLPGKGARVELRAAISPTNEWRSGIAARLELKHGQELLAWSGEVVEAKRREQGNITRLHAGMRQLSWPEGLRRSVEQGAAMLPPWSERWLRLRLQLRENSYSIFLGDQLLHMADTAEVSSAGGVRIALIDPGVSLAATAVRPLPAEDQLFWPVGIAERLNAKTIGKAKIARNSLPPANQRVVVAGVPFLFPVPNEAGDDHIDLSASLFQGGNLKGWLAGGFGELGGRFAGTTVFNPARICFTVPTARYRAIHLIAAYDGKPDTTPIVTAQFYRRKVGFPENFAVRVPLFSAPATATPLPVELEGGGSGTLHLVTIPVEPGQLAGFQDWIMEVELTKEVQLYRDYPDPVSYSAHAAGLPSGVHVYAMTLERPALEMELEPDQWGYVWTAPQSPKIVTHLHNRTSQRQQATVTFAAQSFDGSDRISATRKLTLKSNASGTLEFPFTFQRYGHYTASMELKVGDQTWIEPLGLAHLQRDTRERGNWQRGRGQLFGCSYNLGSCDTPPAEREVLVMGLAGAEQVRHLGPKYEAAQQLAEKFGMVNITLANTIRTSGTLHRELTTGVPEKVAISNFLASIRSNMATPDKVNRPMIVAFYAEPHIGASTYGTRADYLGDTNVVQMPPELIKRAQQYGHTFAVGARAVKQEWPGTLCLMPHGDIMFAATVLEYSPEARAEFDGFGDDMHGGDRLPEKQIHQCEIHRHVMLEQMLDKMGLTNLFRTVMEGPYIPTRAGSLSTREQADLLLRSHLLLTAHGTDAYMAAWLAFADGRTYGENYSGADGLFERRPICTPRPSYPTYATLTRQLNRMNYDGWLPTGSLSVYALRFRHWQSSDTRLVVWTVRGTRPVTIEAADTTPVIVTDMMDNDTTLTPVNGYVTFEVSASPVYITGAKPATAFMLGSTDHCDSAPAAPVTLNLGNPGDGTWRLDTTRDVNYEESMAEFVRRIPGVMTATPVAAPEHAGAKALAVSLGTQVETNLYMPYYTTLVPQKPIVIPGKASYIGLWVEASSDWGRVSYALRDAKGERWLSVGSKGAWNCDDMGANLSFCFDGWRYLRFELPSHAPYDCYRENGTTWWGSYSEGDEIIDLPLTLEKIMIERRTHAIHVNDAQPAATNAVLLGDLIVEYATEEAATPEAVRLAKLRMPLPGGVPALDNPIVKMAQEGVSDAPTISNIEMPEQDVSGRLCHVNFPAVANAKGYDIWVSPYADGRGAIKLGSNWKEPGQILRGLQPDVDFYLFLVVIDADGKPSKPSPAFKIRLKNMFTQSLV